MSTDPPPGLGIDTEVDRSGRTVIVRLSGELDLLHADDLAEHLADITRAASPAPDRLTVDLSQVTFLSSRGLGALVETQRRLRGSLRLTGVTGRRPVERVIELAGLRDFFTIEE